MKTALFTVAYPQAKEYFPDFFASVAAQNDRAFDLLIVNDGVAPYLLASGPNVKVASPQGSAVALRKFGIKWMQDEGYEAAVFADIDDRFDADRVAVSRRLLMQRDLVVNELVPFGQSIVEPKALLSPRLSEGQSIGEEQLRRSNCMGLSNTAARVSGLGDLANAIPDDVIAFDWALFARTVIAGANAIFTGSTRTGYRQHGANIAGIYVNSEEQIIRGVGVKADHYAQLADCSEWYTTQAEAYEQLRAQLNADADRRRAYCARVRSQQPLQPFWWESIRLEEEFA
jgi:glycosyltransferase involved in cell wall biosynthesis